VPSDGFEAESLPLLGPTVAVLTRDKARHAADCPLSIEPVELGAPDRAQCHSALTKTLGRVSVRIVLFMRP
jgi:hypothetical protein